MKRTIIQFSRVLMLTAAVTGCVQMILFGAGGMNVNASCPTGQVSGTWSSPVHTAGYPKQVTVQGVVYDADDTSVKFTASASGSECGVNGQIVYTTTYVPHQGGTTATYVPPPPPDLP